MNMESFVQGSNPKMNFMDGSFHSTHPVAKEVRPYDACFAWYAPGTLCAPHKLAQWRATLTNTMLWYFTVQYVPELCMIYGFCCVMNFLQYDGFRVIASETGSLYECLRQRGHLTSDEIMWTLDKLQHIALHHMKDIACHQANGVVDPEVPTRPIRTPSTSTTWPLDGQNSSRTSTPEAVATPS